MASSWYTFQQQYKKTWSEGGILPKILVFWSPKNAFSSAPSLSLFVVQILILEVLKIASLIYCHQICSLSPSFRILYTWSPFSFKYVSVFGIATVIQFVCTLTEKKSLKNFWDTTIQLYICIHAYIATQKYKSFRLHQIYLLSIYV